jgi:hypothetical protein
MGLVTRFFGPNRKGSELTIKEMDDNLYYLQSLGVSGITYQNNTLSFINPTGGTKDVLINDIYTTGATYNSGVIYFDRNDQLSAYTVNISSLTGDANTFATAFTYNNLTNTLTITDNTNTSLDSYIDSFSGLTVNGNLSATTATITNRSGTPSQAASFDTNGKLVAGLGQTTFSAFGTATLSITSSVTTFTVLPGVTQTITVPSNCSVLITTDGGMNTTSQVTTSIATIDVAIFIDGDSPTNGGYRRVSAHNPSGTAINSTGIPWSLSTIQTLSPGIHTIDVRAVYVIGSNTSVSSNNTNARQAGLYITIIKN